MRYVTRTIILCFLLSGPVYAQDKFHVFPQVADGVFSDGTYYKSTFMILPWFDSDAPNCSLRFYGMTTTLTISGLTQTSNTFNFTIPAGGHVNVATPGPSNTFRSGYATLTCSDYVFAQVLYSFYSRTGVKLSEATVFSSASSFRSKMIIDQQESARLGLAIANNTDILHTYRISIGTRTADLQVPARAAVARFVDELITQLPNPALGILKIETNDFSDFSAIGLRYTGTAFTTIPAN